MTADELRKISTESKPVISDIRLEKYVEWLQRDCVRAAQAGKFSYKVDYSVRPLKDEFILQIQDRFIADGCTIIPNEDMSKFREFIIDWTPVEETKPKDNVI